jgi:hypothetical protein
MHGGRRGLPCRRGGALLVERAHRRARLGAGEGGGQLVLGLQPAEPKARRGCLQWHSGRLGRGPGRVLRNGVRLAGL